MSIHFYDSANPQAVPSGVYAAVYVNGDFAWPQRDIMRMERIFHISVLSDPHWATVARCIDIERGAATPADAIPFLVARHRHNGDATAYVNRSNYAETADRCKRAGIPVFFWVATLDGTQEVEGAWAVQYAGGVHAAFDLNVLHGTNDLVRP